MVLLDVTLLEKGRYNRDLNRLGADKTLGYFSFLYLDKFNWDDIWNLHTRHGILCYFRLVIHVNFRREFSLRSNSRRISGRRFSPSEIFRRERSDERKCVCCSRATWVWRALCILWLQYHYPASRHASLFARSYYHHRCSSYPGYPMIKFER